METTQTAQITTPQALKSTKPLAIDEVISKANNGDTLSITEQKQLADFTKVAFGNLQDGKTLSINETRALATKIGDEMQAAHKPTEPSVSDLTINKNPARRGVVIPNDMWEEGDIIDWMFKNIIVKGMNRITREILETTL